jgi:hypothetical protein
MNTLKDLVLFVVAIAMMGVIVALRLKDDRLPMP